MNNNIYPRQLIIETTSRCNLQCKFCPNLEDKNKQDMDLELFNSIIEKINNPNITVIPWMNGEPLLHPDYLQMLKKITSKNLRCYVTTNGTIWNDEIAKTLTKKNSIYQIVISLDGLHTIPNDRTIELSRPGTSRNQVIASIKSYVNFTRNTQGEKTTDVAVKLCDRGQDYEHIENYIKYWLKEVDFVVVGKRLGIENETPMRTYPCQYFDNNFMVIRTDGTLVACAYHNEVVNNNILPIGNIKDFKTIEEAYNNKNYKYLRELHKQRKFPKPCNTCSFAYTGKGFRGIVDLGHKFEEVYYHQDYYNQFFSLTKKWKDKNYYGFKNTKGTAYNRLPL